MIYYFFKQGCQKCDWRKKEVNLKELNVQEMDIETVDGLEGLAWHELVTVAETQLPILVLDDMSTITGAINIKNYLLNLKEKLYERDKV
jgi:hypothetical protein